MISRRSQRSAGNTSLVILRWAGLVGLDLIQVVDVFLSGSFIQTHSFVCESVCEFQWCPPVFQCCSYPTVDIWLLFSLGLWMYRVILVIFFSRLSHIIPSDQQQMQLIYPFKNIYIKTVIKNDPVAGKCTYKDFVMVLIFFSIFFCLNTVI